MQQFLQPAPKSAEEETYLRAMLHDHPQFRLPEPKLSTALSYFRRQEVAEGEVLIPQVRNMTRRYCRQPPVRAQETHVALLRHVSGIRCRGLVDHAEVYALLCGACSHRTPPPTESICCLLSDNRKLMTGPICRLQGQTGKYFFVVQTGTFALKLPAKKPEHAKDEGSPEQTVSASAFWHDSMFRVVAELKLSRLQVQI